MNTVFIVVCSIVAVVGIITIVSKKSKKDEYDPIPDKSDDLSEISDFDRKKYTKSYLTKAMKSVLIDEWKINVDGSSINMHKSGEGKSSLSFRLYYDFKSSKFNINECRLEVYSNGDYSSDITIYGDKSDLSNDFIKFCYDKYFTWKSDRIKREKEEVDAKLKAFGKVIGKSFDRDVKFDELLN